MEANKVYLANLESIDNGKPFNDAIFDMDCSIKTIQYYAGWCDKIHGNTIPAGGCTFFSLCHLYIAFNK